jgi:SHS2 domain-containing protein
MQTRRKLSRGDAFERAIRETFGETTTLAKVEEARQLYARYRTEDLLNSLKKLSPDKNDKSQPWE